MKQAVSRTRESLSSKIEGIAALTRTVDEQALEELETALLTSDLGVQTTTTILDALRDRARRQAIEGGEELRACSKPSRAPSLRPPSAKSHRPAPSRPKSPFWSASTAPAKPPPAANWPPGAAPRAHSVLLCAADTFRAAAIEQLEVWAARSGVEMIKTRHGGDPGSRALRRHRRRQSPQH